MNFSGKWIELENIVPSKVTQSQKDMRGMNSLKWMLAINYMMIMIHPTDPKKLINKEGPIEGA